MISPLISNDAAGAVSDRDDATTEIYHCVGVQVGFNSPIQILACTAPQGLTSAAIKIL